MWWQSRQSGIVFRILLSVGSELTWWTSSCSRRSPRPKPWDSAETDEGKPVVVVEGHASFTGLDGGSVDLTAPIPNPAVF